MSKKVSQDDVWGVYNLTEHRRESNGMLVAGGYGKVDPKFFTQPDKDKLIAQLPEVCPVWGDTLPYKSVTVICMQDQVDDVFYWLSYVHGGGCVSRVKELEGNRVALRSDYQCW